MFYSIGPKSWTTLGWLARTANMSGVNSFVWFSDIFVPTCRKESGMSGWCDGATSMAILSHSITNDAYVARRLCRTTFMSHNIYVARRLCRTTFMSHDIYVARRLCRTTFMLHDVYVARRLCRILIKNPILMSLSRIVVNPYVYVALV
jgi:hypothetical protein